MNKYAFDTFYHNKSDDKSAEFLAAGNDFFEKKEFLKALFSYNKAIAYAQRTKSLVSAYIKRSVALYYNGRFKECLESVEWLSMTYNPQDKILVDIVEKSKKAMEKDENQKDMFEIFKLSYPPNPKIPWLADVVEMRWTEKYGRGIYATRDLKAGDIISMEEVMYPILSGDACFAFCANCLKSRYMNLIPCDKSATYMFCSTACKEDFYSKAVDIRVMFSADMRVLSEVAGNFGGVKKFDEFLKNTDWNTLKKTIFDYDFSDPNDPKYKENKIMCFLSLPRNDDVGVQGQYDSQKHLSWKNVQYLVKLYVINSTASQYKHISLTINITSQGYPLFGGLLNHCCDSNVSVATVDNKFVTFVTKPIKKGEQLFICFSKSPDQLEKMQKIIDKFQCDCKYCINKQKLPESEIDLVPVFYIVTKNHEKAREYLEEAWNQINNNPQHQNAWSRYVYGATSIMESFASMCSLP